VASLLLSVAYSVDFSLLAVFFFFRPRFPRSLSTVQHPISRKSARMHAWQSPLSVCCLLTRCFASQPCLNAAVGIARPTMQYAYAKRTDMVRPTRSQRTIVFHVCHMLTCNMFEWFCMLLVLVRRQFAQIATQNSLSQASTPSAAAAEWNCGALPKHSQRRCNLSHYRRRLQ
jgi:hypothetical protein